MGPQIEEAAPTTEAAPKASVHTNRPDSTRPRPPTQRERVLAMLRRGWVCGVNFLNSNPPIVRYTGRIHELREDGYQIDRRPCDHPWHQHGAGVHMWQWKLVGEPGDPTLLPGLADV